MILDMTIELEPGGAMNKTELDDALDLLCDCVNQYLFTDENGIITHSFMSVEEDMCDFLEKHGRLVSVGNEKYKFKTPENKTEGTPS